MEQYSAYDSQQYEYILENNAKQKHILHCANDVLAVLGFVKLLNVFRNKKISQIMTLHYILCN